MDNEIYNNGKYKIVKTKSSSQYDRFTGRYIYYATKYTLIHIKSNKNVCSRIGRFSKAKQKEMFGFIAKFENENKMKALKEISGLQASIRVLCETWDMDLPRFEF